MTSDHYTACAESADHIVVRMPSCDYGMSAAQASDLSRRIQAALKEAASASLRYCPFCGAPKDSLRVQSGDGAIYYVLCLRCKACGPIGDTPEAAIKAWNINLRAA